MQTGNQGEALGCCVSQRPMAKGIWLSYLSVFISVTCPGLPWISGEVLIFRSPDHPITRSRDLPMFKQLSLSATLHSRLRNTRSRSALHLCVLPGVHHHPRSLP